MINQTDIDEALKRAAEECFDEWTIIGIAHFLKIKTDAAKILLEAFKEHACHEACLQHDQDHE